MQLSLEGGAPDADEHAVQREGFVDAADGQGQARTRANTPLAIQPALRRIVTAAAGIP
jgi:hypothetical protein